MKKDLLSVYSKDCLACGHFVDSLTVAEKECHHSRGNTECPASQVRIVLTGHLKTMARSLVEARNAQDPKKEASILALVAKESETARATFYRLLDTATRQRAGQDRASAPASKATGVRHG